jgi:hypothetical protein
MVQREEESLIDEMRATIRGDRERAAARVAKAAPTATPEPEPAEAPPEPGPQKRTLRRLFGR